MKIDLGRKLESGEKLTAMDVSPDKTHYPHTCIYDIGTSEVKGVKPGDTLKLEAKVTEVTTGEEGVQRLELDIISLDNGRKATSTAKSKAQEDMDDIDKAIDSAENDDPDESETSTEKY